MAIDKRDNTFTAIVSLHFAIKRQKKFSFPLVLFESILSVYITTLFLTLKLK